MGNKITTIVDKDGEVYTGKEVGRTSHAGGDIITAIATCGLSELAGRTPDTVTVRVNDQEHRGREAKK